MEHPVKEAPRLIRRLCSGTPREQQAALEAHFTRDAAFRHALCRVPSFGDVAVPLLGTVNSRWVLGCVYRWYKVLSPRIEVEVGGVDFDHKRLVLYVPVAQVFSLFVIPFYSARVSLVTVLHLVQREGKFYITAQEDFYQPDEFVKFFWPGGQWVVAAVQWLAVVLCVLGALVLAPPVRALQRMGGWKMD